MINDGPQAVAYIHLRVSRADYDRCVACGRSGTALPNLPFTGFIQAKSAVRQSLLQAWLDAVWTPVCSKLCSDPQYRREFMEPTDAAAFVYFLVRGKPGRGMFVDCMRNVSIFLMSRQPFILVLILPVIRLGCEIDVTEAPAF